MPRFFSAHRFSPLRLLMALACLALATACGASTPAAPTQPPDFAFTVHVQALDSGNSIPRARVAVFPPGEPTIEEMTDIDGNATLRIASSAAGQKADLEVKAPGYIPQTKELKPQPDALTFVMKLPSAPTATPPPTETPLPSPTPPPTPTSTPTATPPPTQTPTPTPAPSARITSHANSARVPRFIQLMGDYTANMTDDLWVFVLPSNDIYYPQSPNVATGEGTYKLNGRWEVRTGLGLDENVNQPFDIILAAANPEASRFISTTLVKWHAINDYPGFAELPPGIQEMDRISVRRTADIYEPAPDVSSEILPGKVTIDRFVEDKVDAATVLSGTYEPAIMEEDLWVLVYPSFGRYYPQSIDACVGAHAQRNSRGQWWVNGAFGDDRDGGKPFDIVVVVANPEASQILDANQRQWCAEGRYPGYLTIELPQGLMEKARYRVYRK